MKRLCQIVMLAALLRLTSLAMAEDDFAAIDLQPYANKKVTEGFGNDTNTLSSLPTGETMLGKCKFKIGAKRLQLGSSMVKDMPEKIDGIKVDRKLEKLHILHATQYGGGPNQAADPGFVDDGTVIGEYRVNFEDHSAVIIPIVYGEDVRDWFFVPGEKKSGRSEVVWEGDNEYATSVGARIQLYATTWENPWPDKVITTIDCSSKNDDTPAAPFCVAMTAEGSP